MRTKGYYVAAAALAALLSLAAQSPSPAPRPTPAQTPWPNKPPTVKLVPSDRRVLLVPECAGGPPSIAYCPSNGSKAKLSAQAKDPDGDTMLYTYSTTGGRLEGEGPEVTLDLKGVTPGTYTVTVEVDDGNGGVVTDATEIEAASCYCPGDIFDPPPCPTVTVSCPDARGPDRRLIFTANVSGGDPDVTPTFKWTVSAGTISGGQGAGSITVDNTGLRDWVTATVEVVGYDRSCATSNSCTISPGDPPTSRKVDEYGDIRIGAEKLRLDNLAGELRNDPTSQLYLICYGGRRGEPRVARRRCERAKHYLIGRGLASDRVVTLGGGRRAASAIEAWIVPAGATPPQPSPTTFPRGRERP